MEKIIGPRQWKSRTDEIIEINKRAEEEKEVKKGIENKTKEGDDDDDAGTPPPFTKE